MSFRLVSKSVTLNDLERRNGLYFALFHRIRYRFRGALRKSGWICRRKKVHVRYLISWWVCCFYWVIAQRWPNRPTRLELRCVVHPSVRPSTKSFFFGFDVIWCAGRLDLDGICAPARLRPDPRSRSRSLSFWISENCTFLGVSSPPFWRGAQNWWLIITAARYRQSSVNGKWRCQWEMAIFDLPQNRHPSTDHQVTGRRRPLQLCQIWCIISVHRRLLGEWVKYNRYCWKMTFWSSQGEVVRWANL